MLTEKSQSTGESSRTENPIVINSIRASVFTVEQEAQLRQLKEWKPYCIVWGAVNVQTEPHTFEMHADYTRHKLNRYLRNGWLVATVG